MAGARESLPHRCILTIVPCECHAGGRLFPHDVVSNCWFVAQDAEGVAKWSDYLFMTSIQFLVQREMVEIAPRSAVPRRLPTVHCTRCGTCCALCKSSRTLCLPHLQLAACLEWQHGLLVHCRRTAAPQPCSWHPVDRVRLDGTQCS